MLLHLSNILFEEKTYFCSKLYVCLQISFHQEQRLSKSVGPVC